MVKLVLDPNNAHCPDYNLDIYENVRAPLVNADTSHQQAAEILTNIWTAQNVLDCQQWQEQLDQDIQEAEVRRQHEEEELRLRREEDAKEKEDQRKEGLKKHKAKFAAIPAQGVPSQPPVITALFAMRRMEKEDYVPLWYYTNAGLDDALKSYTNIDDDTLSLLRRPDGSTSIIPASSARDAKAVIEDQDIPWEEFCIAAPRMIEAMGRAKWPPERIVMMGQFWANIQSHKYRSSRDPLDRSALILYQAEQRRLWHVAINSPGYAYDLSQINENLLRETKDRLYWSERARKDKESDNLVSCP